MIEIFTPTLARDFPLVKRLCESVSHFAPPEAMHTLCVPDADLITFASLENAKTKIVQESAFLPRHLAKVMGTGYRVNLKRPIIPVRGWMTQQLLKLSAVNQSNASGVLIVDSDVEFIRPFTRGDLQRRGVDVFYSVPGGVNETLPLHAKWYWSAQDLLGEERSPQLPLPDHVSSLNYWIPDVVRTMLAKVEKTSSKPWMDKISTMRTFSEFMLYGVYAAGQEAYPLVPVEDIGCSNFWPDRAMTDADVSTLINTIGPSTFAMMVSAKSATPMPVRIEATSRARTAAAATTGRDAPGIL